jgi:Na+/phosphate symporter
MNPVGEIAKYVLEPPSLNGFGDYAMALVWMLAPWLITTWLASMAMYSMVPSRRQAYGALTAVRLGWAWGLVVAGLVIVANAAVLWALGRIPDWSALVPHATFVVVGLILALVLWSDLRAMLKRAQAPLQRAAQGGR